MSEKEECYVEPIQKPLDKDAMSNAFIAIMAVHGMGCPQCATRVSNSLLSLDGVLSANVQLDQGLVSAAYNPEQLEIDNLVKAVADAGNDGRHHYSAELISTNPARTSIA